MDLVNLARTSKALRQLLMSRKSIWVWIVARRNAGAVMVPDPPEDMSEPAWALLLFGPSVCWVRSPLFSRIVSISSRCFGHSNAIRRTFIMSILPSAVACASPVRRESDVASVRIDFNDPDRELSQPRSFD